MFFKKKTKDKLSETLTPSVSQKQQFSSFEINKKQILSSSTSNYTSTETHIIHKFTNESCRNETKSEIFSNCEVWKNVKPQTINSDGFFDAGNFSLSKTNSKQFESPLQKYMNDKKEIKKPAINTFNQGNYNNSLLIKATENLQTPIVKQPVLSVPKQTISLSSTFPSSSSTASSYVSPYKRPSLLNKDDTKTKNPSKETFFKFSTPSNSKSKQWNFSPNSTFENNNNERSSTTSLQNSKLFPLTALNTKINSGTNILKEIPNTSAMISNSKPKKLGPGVLYIFHHDIFKDSSTKYREGSQHDVQILKKTFTKFNVKNFVYENYTVSNIQKIMKRVSNQNFKKNSCIVFAILSHGNRMDQIAAYDGNYSINDDILFQVIKNEDLRGKPKILIVQACKGSFDIRNFDTDEADSNTHGKVNPGVPDEIYKFYSTCEGFVSFRNSTGSVFIQQFCSALENYGEKKNIKEIMELTIQKVKDQTGNKQIPSMCVNNTVPYIFGDYK